MCSYYESSESIVDDNIFNRECFMKTDIELQEKITSTFDKEANIHRLKNNLVRMLGKKTSNELQKKDGEAYRNALFFLYQASQIDAGKTRWRDKLSIVKGDIEPYRKEDYDFYSGVNAEEGANIRRLPINHFLASLSAKTKKDEPYLKRENLYKGEEEHNPEKGLPRYIKNLLMWETSVHNIINIHQRINYDFSLHTTSMDDGLDDAIEFVQSMIDAIDVDETHVENVYTTITKNLELNLIQNDTLTTIASAKLNKNLDWIDLDAFIRGLRSFESLDDLKYALRITHGCELPSGFVKVVEYALVQYVKLRLGGNFEYINDCSYFLMAFILLTFYVNKTSIKAKVLGETNPGRSIYSLIAKSVEINSERYLSADVRDYINDKFALLASLPLDIIAETGDIEIIEAHMISYANYRIRKHELINSNYERLRNAPLSISSRLLEQFSSAQSAAAK